MKQTVAHMPLPYDYDALEPTISRETLRLHHGKHHKTYVDKLNRFIEGTDFEDKTLETIMCTSKGVIYNNAAQVWNHEFYWQCMTPDDTRVSDNLSQALDACFGSTDKMKTEFNEAASGLFGSGWTWLVADSTGNLEIVNGSNAENPLCEGKTPILTCDVWEHAYYMDYQNARGEYLEAFWKVVNWAFVSTRYETALHHMPTAANA